MIAWWNELALIQQIFAMIAIPSTVIMLIQTVMLVIGMAGDSDADFDDGIDDAGDDGLALFSIRGVSAMLAVTGWCTVAFIEGGLDQLPAILISVVLGILTLFGIAYLMKMVYRLQSSGNIEVGNAVGKVAQVYIPIAANAAKSGKVTITIQEKYCEMDAITTASETLKTGSYVRVISVDEAGMLLVEPLAKQEADE